MELETSLGNLLRRAHRGISRRLEEKIEAYGVTIGMWYFLRVLWEEDGITQSELSERIGVMGPTTVSALERIERSGWIDRQRDVNDRRKVIVRLTAKGRALGKKLIPLASQTIDEACEGLTKSQARNLAGLLSVVVTTIESK